MGNSLCDLTHLLFSDGKIVHLFFWIDFNVQFLKEFFGIFDHFLIINAEPFLWFTSDKNILSYGKITYHVQLLMHDYNTCILRFSCVMEFSFLSFIGNGS